MLYTSVPRRLQKIWAEAADGTHVRTVPFATSGDAGAASYQIGWPPQTFLDTGAGGTPPDGRDFNGLGHDATAWAQWQAAGGPIFFDATFATAIGGYPKYAVLCSTTLGRQWQSQVDNNSVDPDAGPSANWVQLLGGNDLANSESVTLPNGAILKSNVVYATLHSQGVYSYTFAVPFPTACRSIVLTPINASSIGSSDGFVQLIGFSASGFSVMPQDTRTGGVDYIDGFTWDARGY